VISRYHYILWINT